MAGETDRLVNFCREANPLYDPAEYDVVVASGEQVTSGLLALTLQAMGCKARSWLGWQLPIHTIEAHAKARIDDIDSDALLAAHGGGRDRGDPRLPGRRPTTAASPRSGRGGSDTSAVAVAAAIGADRCDIYTDVDGVYTTDPRIVARARKLKYVTYEEMLELASVGAKVLQTRSVSLAMKEGVRVQVLSSFIDDDADPGRRAARHDDRLGRGNGRDLMERRKWNASWSPASRTTRTRRKIILTRVPDGPARWRTSSARSPTRAINVDMIIQNVGRDKGETDVTFTVPQHRPRPRTGAARGSRAATSASTASSPTARSPRSASSASA